MPNQRAIGLLKRLKYYISLSIDYYRPSTLFTYFVKNNYPLFVLRLGLFLGVSIHAEAVAYAAHNNQYQVLELFAKYSHRRFGNANVCLYDLLQHNIEQVLNSESDQCDTYLHRAEILMQLGAIGSPWDVVTKSAVKNTHKLLKIITSHLNIDQLVMFKTSLIYAAEHNKTDAAIFLINAGADLTVRTPDGYSAMWWAKYHNNSSIITALKEKGVSTDEKLEYKDEPRDYINLSNLFSYSALELLVRFSPGSGEPNIIGEQDLLARFPDLVKENIAHKLFMQNIVSRIMDLYTGVTDDVILKFFKHVKKAVNLSVDSQVHMIKDAVRLAIKAADISISSKLSKILFANIMQYFDGANANWGTWARLYKCEFLPAFKAARAEQESQEKDAKRYHPITLNLARRKLIYTNAKKLAEEHSADVRVLTQQKFRQLLGF